MNLPNKITVFRMLLIPVFLYFLLSGSKPYNYMVALVVFLFACATDWLDGYLARRQGIVTNFGKLMDPLADKLLVMSALVCFVEFQDVSAWVVVVILAREFIVTSIRLIAASSGKVLAADRLGKSKTVVQMVWISCILLLHYISVATNISNLEIFVIVISVLMWLTLLLTVLSGLNYCIVNRKVFWEKGEK